jgi:hypothetical protein
VHQTHISIFIMADEGGNNDIVRFTYTGQEEIPLEATHIFVGEDVTFVRAHAFYQHPNIVEVICHEKVIKIEEEAFWDCPSLKRVIMPGVKIVEQHAFCGCEALEDVECGKLEIIEWEAFSNCISLRSINLPSARIVRRFAFFRCHALKEVKFGNKLERISYRGIYECCAFSDCKSLERITIPLKDGLIPSDDTFTGCENLNHVDLVEGELNDTVAALHLEEWRNNMNEAIISINRNLPDASVGYYISERDQDDGEKAQAMRRWIRSVLRKINHYKTEHDRLLNEVAATLQLVMPCDVAMNSVLSFLAALPLHEFEVVDELDEEVEAEDVDHGEEAADGGEVSEGDDDDDQDVD